jgi:hypothetical protein
MTEVTLSEEGTTTGEVSELPEKCLTRSVQTAALKLRYLSGLTLIDQYTAESVFRTIGNPEKIGINLSV